MKHFPLRQSMILTTSFFLLATVQLENIFEDRVSEKAHFLENKNFVVKTFDVVQFETRNFGHHCQYTVKKCQIGFTLLTSILPFDDFD
jgi:hypothetical protein